MDITIKQINSSLLDDFLYYFEKIAFTDNPEWSGCYCQHYHFEGKRKDWAQRTDNENREAAINLINSGKMNGFLVYHNGNPIGWCNVNLKDVYPVLIQDADINYETEEKIASIVCFLIAPNYRRKGIARKLLEFISEYYTSKKINYIEAYPRKNVKSDAHNYKGPMHLYKSEGFSIYKEFDSFYIVRKSL